MSILFNFALFVLLLCGQDKRSPANGGGPDSQLIRIPSPIGCVGEGFKPSRINVRLRLLAMRAGHRPAPTPASSLLQQQHLLRIYKLTVVNVNLVKIDAA